MSSTLKSAIAATLFVGASLTASAAVINPVADVVFIVDESGSMSGEHAWLSTLITGANGLDAKLATAGVTDRKYWLIGYGGGGAGNNGRSVGTCSLAGCDATTFSTSTSSLVTSGSTEDGYAGMNFALSSAGLRTGSARNFILVTDEDRDSSGGPGAAAIQSSLQSAGVVLNVVVNASFGKTGFTGSVIGIDDTGIAYTADGSGGYGTQPATFDVTTDAGNTEADYVDLMRALNGAAWDINILRSGGLAAQSFTAAFTDIKVQEIIAPPPPPPSDVPAPASLALFGAALASMGWARRRG